jgi:hypothetical protein
MDEFIKSFGKTENGNGVYVVKHKTEKYQVVIVYSGGFLTDYPIQYFDDTIAYDAVFIHSQTTKKLVKRAYSFIKRLKKQEEQK